jgi:hypothetical protein
MPPFVVSLLAWLFVGAHLVLIITRLSGGLWIKKLSPDWAK